MNDRGNPPEITAESLGSARFRQAHGVRLAYVAGAMYKGIASKELVVRMGRGGMLGFLGTGGLSLARIEDDLAYIRRNLDRGQAFGANLLCNLIKPQVEEDTVQLYLRLGVRRIEAAAYAHITPSLALYRLKGARREPGGAVVAPNKVLAKASRPEVAAAFFEPPPRRAVEPLLARGLISAQEAALADRVPMCDDLCVEADSGGHTDQGSPYTLMPAILRLRDQMAGRFPEREPPRVGAAGGIGAPQAAAAAFVLGADFILTGSINQCSVESGASDAVKDLLARANVQDTAIAPAGDMFEVGALVQVLRKGLFFPARAWKLYNLYRHCDSWEAIDPKTRSQIEGGYFQRPAAEVWRETRDYYAKNQPEALARAERDPKFKLSLLFRWYFIHTTRLALRGDAVQKVDYQIHCGPAMGAFNQWVKGTPLADWRNRHVDEIGARLMSGAAAMLTQRFHAMGAASVARG